MNTDLRKKQKMIWRENFVKLMNNTVFGKTMGSARKHTDIKFVKKERKRNYLVSEPNYHTTDFFSEMLLVTEI